MPDKFTNLLPPERDRLLSRAYALRVLVVAAAMVTVLTLAAAALLAPTYVYLTSSEQAKKVQLANIESKVSPADDITLSARLATLSANTTALLALSAAPSASILIRDTLAIAHPRIILSGFSYAPPAAKKPGTLTVSGSAATRDALRDYQLALQEVPFISSAALPVSAYAKDTDIAFTITLTLAPHGAGLAP